MLCFRSDPFPSLAAVGPLCLSHLSQDPSLQIGLPNLLLGKPNTGHTGTKKNPPDSIEKVTFIFKGYLRLQMGRIQGAAIFLEFLLGKISKSFQFLQDLPHMDQR